MKVALKCWAKDPFACIMYAITFLMDLIGVAISTWLIQLIPLALNPATFNDVMIKIIIILIAQIAISAVVGYGYRIAKMHLIKILNANYAKKMLDAQYRMFTEVSCAKVYTVGEFMWNSAKIIDCIADMIELAFTITATIYAMANIGGILVIPIITIYAIFAIVLKIMYKTFNKLDSERATINKARNQEMENIINGFEIVRIFNTAKRHMESIDGKVNDSFTNQCKKSSINSTLRAIIATVDSIGIIITILFSIWQIKEGNLTAAVAMSLVMYVTKLIPPLTALLRTFDEISENLAYAKDYDMILKYDEINNSKRKINLHKFNNKIIIDNVGFKYDDSDTVLNGINITIHKGQKIGICGQSGGGKSTLGKLLNRFYEPTEGNIYIDGINISEITNDSYAANVGCVPQDTVILPGTIRENILYVKPNALEAELIEATKNANLYDFIMSLPNGFDTEVGPKGLTLSGGQKQRIALARVFLQNPEIILLDEATSALDNESETIVQEAIDKLNDKTIITIAHRLSTIKNCDQIYVFGNHKIIEHGSHGKLVKMNGAYASMLK